MLQITTGIHIKNDIQKLDADGSLIDITTVLVAQDLVGVHLNNIIEKIEMAHEGEKILFFSLLSDEYLKELNPKYKDYES